MFRETNSVHGDAASGAGSQDAGANRRERRFDQTRAEILRAARQVMLETGAARLSLREVARRAQFSPAALYNYFSGRDQIVGELTLQSFRLLVSYLDRVDPALPADQRLVELGLAYMRFAEENPADLLCIITADAVDPTDESSDPSRQLGLAALRLLSETLREGLEAGLFRSFSEDELPRTAFALWSLVHGMTSLASVNLAIVGDQMRREPRAILEDHIAGLRRPRTG